MNKDDLDIKALLPSSIADDKTAQALADALTGQLVKLPIDSVLLWDDLAKHSDSVLLNLANDRHTDLYKGSYSRPVKEKLVSDSLLWHKRRGTKDAVQEALLSVYRVGTVREWYEYGGRPYHFKLENIDSDLAREKRESLIRLINLSKNLRSWLDSISYAKNITSAMYVGGVTTISRSYELTLDLTKEGE